MMYSLRGSYVCDYEEVEFTIKKVTEEEVKNYKVGDKVEVAIRDRDGWLDTTHETITRIITEEEDNAIQKAMQERMIKSHEDGIAYWTEQMEAIKANKRIRNEENRVKKIAKCEKFIADEKETIEKLQNATWWIK
jgi:hypothetical protein